MTINKNFRLIFLFITLFLGRGELTAEQPYRYKVSICAIFRDEDRFLKEWIEFHRLVGVEHFWLYNNLSKDNYSDVLRPYIEQGIVELFDWPFESKTVVQFGKIQRAAYEDAIKRGKGITKWLAFIDTDEFLFPVQHDALYDLLSDYEKYGGVCANWQMYGTSCVKRVPEDRLMIELLTCKARWDHANNHFVKTIVRPEKVKRYPNPHYPVYYGNYYTVNTDKQRVKRQKGDDIIIDKLRINHYWTRDEEFFIEHKIKRWSKPGNHLEYMLKDFEAYNECQDDFILRYAEDLRMNVFLQKKAI